MNKGVVLLVFFISIQNVFCASPLHRRVLTGLAVREKEKKTTEAVCEMKSPDSPFSCVVISAAKDEKTRGSCLPNLNKFFINSTRGILGMFNGPWAARTQGFLNHLVKQQTIETPEEMQSVISMVREKIGKLDPKNKKTTGAIVVITGPRRVLLGQFSGEYVLAVKKKSDVVFLTQTSCGQRKECEVVNPEQIHEFDPKLEAGDMLVLSSPSTIDLLHCMRTEMASEKTVHEAHQVFGGIIESCSHMDLAALAIMENTKKLAGKAGGMERTKVVDIPYPVKTSVLVATIQNRKAPDGTSLEDE